MTLDLLITKAMARLRAGVWRLLTSVSDAQRIYTFTLPGGARFDYPLSSAIGEELFAGRFEPAELAFVCRHLKPGDVVLDLGANAGLYTLLAAQAVGERGHVYAFEPGSRALELLRRNIALNHLTNVTVIEAAVSNHTGEASFAVANDTALSSLADIGRADQQIATWQTVKTVRLDDAIAQYGMGAVSFIKMDVEGAEKLALDGAPHLLSRSSGPLTILFEAFEQNTRAFGYSVGELLDMLRLRGFSLHAFDRSLTLHPLDHLGPDVGTSIYNFVACKN
jgi:FkbM family methyltransferase